MARENVSKNHSEDDVVVNVRPEILAWARQVILDNRKDTQVDTMSQLPNTPPQTETEPTNQKEPQE